MNTLLFLLFLALLLIVPFYIIYKPPAALIRHFAQKWPDVLFEVPTEKKIIALTIDDAPSVYTRQIMELLRANDAKATFFVIGSQVEGREERLSELVRNGNELGNHAMHDEPSRSLSDAQLESEIYEVRKMLFDVYDKEGMDPPNNYFRPGSGFFSNRMRRLVLSSSDFERGLVFYHVALFFVEFDNESVLRSIVKMLEKGLDIVLASLSLAIDLGVS
ncbi:unnamed protein product [Parascedosporium putredinis]|uniref:chitin deacetylase n=1 Tax=Parascedosporium putredinis TaxID=1442378 RepID=A0A9P1MCK5_9PEZI|nr:unnamed protein product [Parascedosporium putredinis]CAI7998596.1 unnamed protein product [Parascedosporium putredinis]